MHYRRNGRLPVWYDRPISGPPFFSLPPYLLYRRLPGSDNRGRSYEVTTSAL
jgi:hypothetical protein